MPRMFLLAPEGEAAPSGAQPAAVGAPAAPVASAPVVAAPAPPVPAAVPVVTPAPAVVATPQTTPDADPTWLKPRLEREAAAAQAKLLKELGISDPVKAKEAIAAANKATEDAKSLEQRRIEAEARAKSLEDDAAQLLATVTTIASSRLASLTEEQRKAVTNIAGEDPRLQIELIEALTPTWSAVATPAVVPPVVAPAVPAPPVPASATPPANTSPPPNAPAGGPTASPPDRKAEYAALKSKSPVAAAAYLNRYENEIFPRA